MYPVVLLTNASERQIPYIRRQVERVMVLFPQGECPSQLELRLAEPPGIA